MTPHQAYRRTSQSGWTRIEMLLAIYDATIETLDAGIQSLHSQQAAEYPALQLRASQLCLLLISGVDANATGVAAHVRELCLFSIDQISRPEVDRWKHARNVMTTLREGFQGVRDEGNQLEAAGTIPSLLQQDAQTLLHV